MKTYIVLGMHRSSTSLVAKGLAGELDMGIDWANNPYQGGSPFRYFEDIRFVGLNDEILEAAGGSWKEVPPEDAILAQREVFAERIRELVEEASSGRDLWGWKDPRTVLTIRLFVPYLVSPHYICCFRDPVEVGKSLERRGDLSAAEGVALARVYNERLLRFLLDIGWAEKSA
jgi:hypothetical protein